MTDSKTIWSYAAYVGLVLGLVSAAYYTCDWALGKFCTEGALIYLGVAAKIALWITKFIVCIVLMKFAMQRFVRDVNGLSGTGSWGSNARSDGNGSSNSYGTTGSGSSNGNNGSNYGTTSSGSSNGNNGSNYGTTGNNGSYGTTGNSGSNGTGNNGSNYGTTGNSGSNGTGNNGSYGTTGNSGSNARSDGSGSYGVTNSDTFRLGAAIAVLSALIYSGFLLAFVLYIQPDLFENTLDSLRESPMLTEAALEAAEAIAPKFPAITFFSNFIYCTLFGTILSVILSRNIPSTNPFKN